jgi:nucleoside-diphosphate-sugar epimerase
MLVRTFLVTGACGYVGGMLTRRLLADGNARVIAVDWACGAHGADGLREILDHERLTFVRADVRDTAALVPHLRAVDAVVHLAAVVGDPAGRRDPDTTRSINVDATKNLVAACGDAGVKHFLFVSTCSNYGLIDSASLADEDTELNPVSLYAETKVAVERELIDSSGFPFTVLRLATVYGVAPRMRFDLTVNQFTIEALTRGVLSIYGEQFWRPYVHVLDVVRAIRTALDQPDRSLGRVFNVGDSSENYTKRMIYDVLRQSMPGLRAEWVSVADDPRSYRVGFDRVRDTLGFAVSRRVPDGIDEVIRYARLGAFPEPDAPRFHN